MNEQVLKKITLLERRGADVKSRLVDKELEYEVAVANATLKSKEEWKELGISNAEGRKAHILLETVDLKKEVNDLKSELLTIESELRIIDKEIELGKV